MTQAILTINAGSSSVKFSAYACDAGQDGEGLVEIGHGQVSGIGGAARFEAHERQGDGSAVQVAGQALDAAGDPGAAGQPRRQSGQAMSNCSGRTCWNMPEPSSTSITF